jgi:hypothetical protein
MIQVIEVSNASRVISASDSPTCRAAFQRQPPGNDRDKHQIVDAQHDLEGGQRH